MRLGRVFRRFFRLKRKLEDAFETYDEIRGFDARLDRAVARNGGVQLNSREAKVLHEIIEKVKGVLG